MTAIITIWFVLHGRSWAIPKHKFTAGVTFIPTGPTFTPTLAPTGPTFSPNALCLQTMWDYLCLQTMIRVTLSQVVVSILLLVREPNEGCCAVGGYRGEDNQLFMMNIETSPFELLRWLYCIPFIHQMTRLCLACAWRRRLQTSGLWHLMAARSRPSSHHRKKKIDIYQPSAMIYLLNIFTVIVLL